MSRPSRLKRWPGWVALLVVVIALLAIGGTRDHGPSTPGERANGVAERVACPVCDGESVADSRNASSEFLRTEIRRLVDDGALSDEEILGSIEQRYGGQILLVPRASGFDTLVWALPVVVLVGAVAGLAITFRRWRREATDHVDPTEADRELVAAALADDADDGS